MEQRRVARFLTNVMISDKPYFLQFSCFKAPLVIDEKEAWKRRHQYAQPMVPSENFLFFVSRKDSPPFIDDKAINEVTLNSNIKDDYRILRYLVHQALKIFFESSEFQKWRSFYSKKDHMTTIKGRFGLSYNVFNGVKPKVFFENGYCMIPFEYSSMIFTRLHTPKDFEPLKKLFLITLCEDCPESSDCENIKHKVSKFLRQSSSRVFMIDVEENKFNCPISSVRVESNPKVMKGEYTRILRRTALTTFEEYHFLSKLVSTLSEGNFILDLGRDIAFSWLKLEA